MRFDDRVTGELASYAPRARKIHVELDPAEVNKNVKVDLAIIGDVREVLRLLADGVIRIPIQATYPLTAAGIADAHRASMTGHAAGKLVVMPR